MKKPTKKVSTKLVAANLLQPRLCHLIKWPDYDGFGFNLMTKKEEAGHFIADVEQLGPADLSGLRDNDRVIEVNGSNVQTEAHINVAQMIAASGDEVKLLVVDEQTHDHYRERGYPLDSSNVNVLYIRTPDKQPNGGGFEPTVVYERNFSDDSYVMNSSRQESTTLTKTFTRYTTFAEPSTVEFIERETNRESVEMTSISNSVKAEPESMNSRESGFVSLQEQCNGKINAPRECQIKKWEEDVGFGFSLNTPKDRRGHFVSKIDEDSPAFNCGIKLGDRIVEVNGVNIELRKHSDITDMIRNSPNNEVTLLVIDEESYKWYCEQGIEVQGNLPNVIHLKNPEPIPESINTAGVHLTPKEERVSRYKEDMKNGKIPVFPGHISRNSVYIEEPPNTKNELSTSVEEPEIQKVSREQNGHVKVGRTESPSSVLTASGQELPHDAPSPRLCHVILVPSFPGFGFGVRTYKATGFKYIVDIKPRSPAYYCGLRQWDRLIEVNGVNVNVDNHSQVCARIQYNPSEIKLLVMEDEEYSWYMKRSLVPKSTQSNVIYLSNLVENVEANSSPVAGNSRVYEMSTAEVRERISTLKRQDPRNKNVDFQKRIELYEQL